LIYECDGDYADAFTTYKKVYEDCPKSLVTAWFARIRMGELASRTTSAESPKAIFEDVARSPHPFVVPRAVAQYYRGVVSNDELMALWDDAYPGDRGYLFCFAKKAVFDGRWDDAQTNLEELEESLPETSVLLLQAVALRKIVHGHQ
jgi:tetratricopeptide (TPR) repeat protein